MRVILFATLSPSIAFCVAANKNHDSNALNIARGRKATSRQHAQPCFIQSGLLDLPESVGIFDAIVGRRVLMYQADTVAAVTELAKHLRPGGVMVFQEHDTTMAPASVDSFELHRKAQSWIQRMIALEHRFAYRIQPAQHTDECWSKC